MKQAPEPLDDVVADPLVLGVLRGDRAAWFQLTLYLEYWVSRKVPRHWRMRKARLQHSEDDLRDVLLEVIERVSRDDFRALRQYLDRKLQAVPDVRDTGGQTLPDATFVSWLHGLVDFAIRDHVRRRYGRPPASLRRRPVSVLVHAVHTKRDLNSWALRPANLHSGEFGGSANPAVTGVLTARAILRYAEETFADRELSVFRRYLEQATFDELSTEFDLGGPRAAEAEIRRLKERLRARFRTG